VANIETKIRSEIRDAIGRAIPGRQIAVGEVAAAILADNPATSLSLERIETAVARVAVRNGFRIIEFGPEGTNSD
jgi:hypothetical protein